jgi:putative Holliday junction resolvase
MRILGIDFGDKHIGLAVSDPLGFTAQALGKYQPKNKKEDKKYFLSLVREFKIGEVVVGFPLKMNGTEGSRAQKTKEFTLWLEGALNLPINLWDERLTTKEALNILRQQNLDSRKSKAYKDQVSATIILSSYLESKRDKSHVDQKP